MENENSIDNRTSAGTGGRAVVLFLLFAAAAFYLMESYEHNPFVEVRRQAQIFNLLLFELIAWTLYLLTGGMRLAIRILLAVSMLFGLINHYVMLFRSTPFVPWDVYSLSTAFSVAKSYDFSPELRVILVSLGFVLLFVMAELLKRAPHLRWRYRLPAVVPVAVVLGIFSHCLQDEGFQVRNYLYPYLFTPGYMTKVNGMAVTFTMNLQYLKVEQPKGYDAHKAKEILESCEKPRLVGAQGVRYPNIIVIMDEAFSDLSVLGGFQTNEDYMPFYHSLLAGADNTVTGNAQVSVCGGNTANSEFEFLTGCTMAFLPDGSIPYQQYIRGNMQSLASHLRELGYQTRAQHPYYAGGWERDEVYPWLGFSETDFLPDYTHKTYVRKYVSDACDFAHVIAAYETKEPQTPLFLFNVTMQNHGGYTDEYENFRESVTAERGSRALNQYLSLLKLTDAELERLIAYFEHVEEPTVLVFFGDHQPSDSVVRPVWTENGVDALALTEEQQRARYQVPYLIWANFDIPEASGADTSLNYLGFEALALANVPQSAFGNYLMQMKRDCPVISAAGWTGADLADADMLKEQLDTYRKLQYYLLFDDGK